MKNNSPIFYIYGIYDASGVCVYIGQTYTPKLRQRRHLNWYLSRFYSTRKRRFKFKIIRTCDRANVSRLEKQIGIAYQRKGQAQQSKRFGLGDKFKRGVVVYVEGVAEPFYSYESAGDYCKCGPNTIQRNMEDKVIFNYKLGTHWKDIEFVRLSAKPIPAAKNSSK